MTDMYVYYFKGLRGSAGENTISTRRATLQAIRGVGEPIMESQVVVDHTELDSLGFSRTQAGGDPSAASDLTAEIDSLERRALSRDGEALHLNHGDSGKDKYMLSLESRELRKQAKALKSGGDGSSARERRNASDALQNDCFEGIPAPE